MTHRYDTCMKCLAYNAMDHIYSTIRSLFSAMFTRQEVMLDLSTAPEAVVREILLRVDSRVLVKRCSLVSKRWRELLCDRHFWVDKWEVDGAETQLPLRLLMPLPPTSFQRIAVLAPFNRNLIKDEWQEGSFHPDARWRFTRRQGHYRETWSASFRQSAFQVESPPIMLNAPEANANEHVEECLATTYYWTGKRIEIDLWQEGLDADILNTLRPTIIVSELVAHRSDCGAHYRMRASLRAQDQNGEEINEAASFETERLFDQWQRESWEKVEHEFRNYPSGVRYLILETGGKDRQVWAGHYGAKMARCSVTVRCDTNRAGE